jgi:hypothetical protein
MSDMDNPGAVVESGPASGDHWDNLQSGENRSDLNSTPAPPTTSLAEDNDPGQQANPRNPQDAAQRLSERKKNISSGVESAFGRFGGDLMNTGWNR